MSNFDKKNERLKIGITGGIGSGKTTVCKIFETLDVPVYYADERAKALMVEDLKLRTKIVELFGRKAYFDDGSLNRKWIADQVFRNEEMLRQLNAIVHPAVMEDGERWHRRQKNAPYTLKEAALLFESGSARALDKIIVVSAPLELRVTRVVERDGVSKEAVKARMENQMPEAEKVGLADFVILNDGCCSLVKQVWEIHRQILSLTKKKT